MTITPEQLPGRASNFIAYGPEERAADPTNNGEVITVRPQIYVRYYPGLVVSALKSGGRSGERKGLVTVHFDPTSIGFKDPISAHMNDDDQTLFILQNSLENKVPLAIAIETQRKKKNTADGTPISPLTPIHALRGADHPNGDGDAQTMMGPSGNNASNRVAFVNGEATQHLQSNPSEWKPLVNNKAGDLPPEGWRNFATGEDWKEIGAAIRAGGQMPSAAPSTQVDAPASTGAFPSPNELSALIRDVVGQTLKEFAPALADQVAQYSSNSSQGRVAGKFYEGRPWDARTSDGRINLGGYVVSAERWVFEWAYGYLSETLETQPSPEEAWTLSEVALTMSSAVQANAYGHGFVSDRESPSHREAEHWVQWTIKHLHAYPGADADEATLKAWNDAVVKDASEFHAKAGSHAGDYYAAVSKRDKNGAAPQSKAEKAPNGPSEKVIRAFLDVIQKGWDNPEALRNLGKQGRDNGYFTYPIPVSMTTTDEGVRLSYPPTEGEETGPLEALLIYRLDMLKAQPSQGPANDGEAVAPQSETAQTQAPAPAPAPEETAIPEGVSSQVESPQADVQATAPQDGDQVASLIERLKVVPDEQSLRAIYEEAKEANLVAAKVFVAPGPNGEVTFGQEGQDGFQPQGLGYIIGVMRQAFVAPAPTQPEAQESGKPEAPTEAPPAQEEPPVEQTEAPTEPEAETVNPPEATVKEEAPVAPEQSEDSGEEATETPDSAPEATTEPAPQDAGVADSDAQRIADAASSASAPEEIASLKAEMNERGLSDAPVKVGGNEGNLGYWIVSQTRRIKRAQGTRG